MTPWFGKRFPWNVAVFGLWWLSLARAETKDHCAPVTEACKSANAYTDTNSGQLRKSSFEIHVVYMCPLRTSWKEVLSKDLMITHLIMSIPGGYWQTTTKSPKRTTKWDTIHNRWWGIPCATGSVRDGGCGISLEWWDDELISIQTDMYVAVHGINFVASYSFTQGFARYILSNKHMRDNESTTTKSA